MISIRTMQLADLPAVMAIQHLCYTDIVPESENSMRAKCQASPATCFVATIDNTVAGYLISLPWEFANPPALNAEHCTLPASPDCLYLHDLAIAPPARTFGAAPALVNACLEQLTVLALHRASLIAIQGSAPYWQRYGFKNVQPWPALVEKLRGYGTNILYMERAVEQPVNRCC